METLKDFIKAHMSIDSESYVVLSNNEYERLQEKADKLRKLENWGVDNWCNYDEAMHSEDTEYGD